MAKFKFKLQSVLDIKTKLEEQKKNELGEAMRQLEDAQNNLEMCKGDYNRAVNSYKANKGKEVNARTFINMNHDIKYYNDRIVEQKKLIQLKIEAVEKVRLELNKVVIEKKTYEILKERAYEEYIYEEKQEESKQLDEIVSYKYSKN